jgi:hypothetical protein
MMTAEYTDIYISADAPLIVRDASALMHYGTVYMEQGAYIEIRAGFRFEIEKLTMAEKFIPSPAAYPTLLPHETLRNTPYHIILTGTDAPDGAPGANGSDWGESGANGETPSTPGGNAPSSFTLTIRELTFDTAICSTGGKGGNGGKGGAGANGFDGSDNDHPGGIGGDGGKGGNGSAGGNATVLLNVSYASTVGCLPAVDCSGGAGGNRGDGGIHGRNGKFYNGSTQPQSGTPGSNGISGQAGKVKITPLTS